MLELGRDGSRALFSLHRKQHHIRLCQIIKGSERVLPGSWSQGITLRKLQLSAPSNAMHLADCLVQVPISHVIFLNVDASFVRARVDHAAVAVKSGRTRPVRCRLQNVISTVICFLKD